MTDSIIDYAERLADLHDWDIFDALAVAEVHFILAFNLEE